MNIYEDNDPFALISGNRYPGRGIIVGMTPDGRNAVFAYFIMGRSENSRNRVFVRKDNGELVTRAFDESKLTDPSLIIYSPVRTVNGLTVVTNGDQTDTIYDYIKNGKTFEQALETREFEPDAPNFTPRISAILDIKDGFDYKMSILKSADAEGSACSRHTFSYRGIKGKGTFIHTYQCDGNPIPSFCGEPERVTIPDDISVFTDRLWDALDTDNKISLYVRYIPLDGGSFTDRLINKNK